LYHEGRERLEEKILSRPWRDDEVQRGEAKEYYDDLMKGVNQGTIDKDWAKERYEKVTGFDWPEVIMPDPPDSPDDGGIDPPVKPGPVPGDPDGDLHPDPQPDDGTQPPPYPGEKPPEKPGPGEPKPPPTAAEIFEKGTPAEKNEFPGHFTSYEAYLVNFRQADLKPGQMLTREMWEKRRQEVVGDNPEPKPEPPIGLPDDGLPGGDKPPIEPVPMPNPGQDVVDFGSPYGPLRKVGKDNRPIPKKPRHVV
jgi:hypothetical protein